MLSPFSFANFLSTLRISVYAKNPGAENLPYSIRPKATISYSGGIFSMEKLKIKDIREEIIEHFRRKGPVTKNKDYGNQLFVLDDMLQKLPGRQIWKRDDEAAKMALTFTLCSNCYPGIDFSEEEEAEIMESIPDSSMPGEKTLQHLKDVFGGPVPDTNIRLSYAVAGEFLKGNVKPIIAFFEYTLFEYDSDNFMELTLKAYKELAFQMMCAEFAHYATASKQFFKMHGMIDCTQDNLEELAKTVIIGGKGNCVPVSEGTASDLKITPVEQLKSSERICKLRPEEILTGAIYLYLDRQEIAFTKLMDVLFDYCIVHMPHADWTRLLFLEEFEGHEPNDYDGLVDVFDDAIHLPCFYVDNLPANNEKVPVDTLPHEQFCLTPANILSALTKYPFYENIVYSKGLEEWFVNHGISREKAHDYTIIEAALSYSRLSDNTRVAKPAPVQESQPEPVDVSVYENEIASLKEEKAKLEEQVQTLQQKLNKTEKQLRVANYELNKRQDTNSLNEQVQMLTWKNQELTDALESITTAVAEEPAEPQNDVQFPYFTNKRVVLFGGHDTFRTALQKLLPDIRLMQPTELSMDVSPIRNADLLCLQPNKCNHPQYWNAVSTAKTNDVPCIHLRYANAELCAKAIVEKLESMTA